MEHTLVRLTETAGWFFAIVFIFALIGVYATIRWIVSLVTRTERDVEGEVANIKQKL
jgi:hypothetical protein